MFKGCGDTSGGNELYKHRCLYNNNNNPCAPPSLEPHNICVYIVGAGLWIIIVYLCTKYEYKTRA